MLRRCYLYAMICKQKKILIIGLVWPEPTSSAAGWRMLQLIQLFVAQNAEIHFASAAQHTAYSYSLETLGVTSHSIQINAASFDEFIQNLQPEIVIYDRFITEEYFGWRVRAFLPKAVTILDTEDLHFVRKAREVAYKQNTKVDYYTTEAQRELSSILRCDLSLIISSFEFDLLIHEFKLPSSILCYLPFLQSPIDQVKEVALPTFAERKHFMFIGNYMHEPNYHTFLRLKNEIWPPLHKALPDAELHLYGAYATQKIHQHHNKKMGFLVKGRADDAMETMKKYRVLLAPIPFGAGLKGKFIEAMQTGLPSCTSTVGAEGMAKNNQWGGYIKDNVEELVASAQLLYTDANVWQKKQQQGFDLLQHQFEASVAVSDFINKLHVMLEDVQLYRKSYFIGQLLHQNQLNAFKYMSKWIEEKNKSL